MRKQGGGTIINVSSGTALMFLEGMGAYSSLKRALVGISLTAREELKKDKIVVSVIYPFITQTDFEKNTLKEGKRQDNNGHLRQADSPEFIAGKILDLIKSGKAEIFAHDWMGEKNNL
jgi:short-subunit dehydrogenase